MDKVLGYFGQDGLLHIICSAIIVAVCGVFMPVWAAAIIGAIIGIGKEFVWDKWLGKGTFDVKDLVADAVGILIGCI